MSWNVGVGIEVPVTDNVAFNIAYKYTDLGSVEYTNGMFYDNHTAGQGGMTRVFDSDVDLYKHEIIAGEDVFLISLLFWFGYCIPRYARDTFYKKLAKWRILGIIFV